MSLKLGVGVPDHLTVMSLKLGVGVPDHLTVMTLKLGVGVPHHLTAMHYNLFFTDTRVRTERRENRDSNPVKNKVLFLPLYHPDDVVGPRSSLPTG